jgi:hypothetical protein
LEHEPTQYGVRLSFAFGHWHELAAKYPAAMAELRNLRDRATQNAVDRIDVHDSFEDAKSLNRVLGDARATRDLFIQLHDTDRNHAQTVYHIARPVLVSFGEYDVCSAYHDADTAIDRVIELYQLHRKESVADLARSRLRDHAENSLRNESATVIALLVAAHRMDDAQTLADRIITDWNDESVRDIVHHALRGDFPPQRS